MLSWSIDQRVRQVLLVRWPVLGCATPSTRPSRAAGSRLHRFGAERETGAATPRYPLSARKGDKQTIVWYNFGMPTIQTVDRRERLLDVAARIFSEQGYRGASMQDLANGLGILKGSIYAHIESKEDLLFEIVDRGADRFINRLKAVASEDARASSKLSSALQAHVETVAEHVEAATVFLNDWKFLSGKRRQLIEAKRNLYQSLIRQIVDEGISAGEFRNGLDPKFATLLVLSSANWVYQWYDPKGPMSPREIANQLSEMILKGLIEGE